LRRRIDQIGAKKKMLIQELEMLGDLVGRTEPHPSQVEDTASHELETLSQQLVAVERQGYRERIAAIERQIEVDLPGEHDELQHQLEDNRREIENRSAQLAVAVEELEQAIKDNLRNWKIEDTYKTVTYNNLADELEQNQLRREELELVIDSYESQASAVEETRVIRPFTRSASPVGPSDLAIVAISVVLGVVLGLGGAVIADRILGARGGDHRWTAVNG
jgi:uncharacterized protein involved in exopolysaccharide biosynthesis